MKQNLLAVLALVFSIMVGGTAVAEEANWSVNINTASEQVLAEGLQGIGESKAKAIVEYREANGEFATIEDLANVRGIGGATIEKNRDNIVLE